MTLENDPSQDNPAPGADASTADPSTATQDEDQDQTDADAAEEGDDEQNTQPNDKAVEALKKRMKRVYDIGKSWEERARKAEEALAASSKASSELVAPREEDYEGRLEDYYKDLGKYEAKKESLEQQQREAKDKADQAGANARKELQRSVQAREEVFAKTHPDYFDVIVETGDILTSADRDNPVVSLVSTAILQEENGAAIAYHIGKNPEFFEDLLDMSPLAAMRALAAIEAPARKPAPAAQPGTPQAKQPPRPPTPVAGNAKVNKDPDKMPMNEWLEWRNKQIKR